MLRRQMRVTWDAIGMQAIRSRIQDARAPRQTAAVLKLLHGNDSSLVSDLIVKMLYGVSFAALALFNAALYYHRHQNEKSGASNESIAFPKENSQEAVSKFKWQYFGPVSNENRLLYTSRVS